LRQQGLTAPETEADPPATTPRRDRTDLLLMDNIETAWINGVLKTALRQTIDLRLTRDGGQPANLVYHRPQGLDRPLINGGGGRLSRLFAAADGSLLILGAPGSGKTITLLQLLDELLQQARADHTAPIPLLFNLSSFANFRHADKGDFVDWLADQAYHQYRLKRETTRQRLASSDFVLLLDGLDEVANADGQREACVAAINTFRQTAPCGLVVCSRITDYRPLHQRLESLHTLLLQPLGNGQIDGFLAALDSPQRQAMQQRVADDWRLREVLRSPLLLNLYPQVFAALGDDHRLVQSPRLDQSAESVEDHRQQLFAAYVETVFADSPRPSERVEEVPTETVGTSGQSLRWLTFLASRMQQVGSSVFFIEELQPTWLPERLNGRYRVGYGALLGLIFGLIQGLSAGLIVGFFGLNGLFHGLDQGWRVGLSSSICGAIATWLTTKVQRSWLQTIAGGVIFFGLVSLMNFGLIGVVNYGLGMTVSIGIASCTSIIQLREKVQFLRPSMARIQHYGKQGVGYGLIFGLISGLISGALDNLRSIPRGSLSEGLSVGLSIGLTIGLGAFLLAFLDNPLVDKQPLSRNGIRTSLRNALLMTLLTALLFGFPSWFIDQWLRAYSFIISIVIDNLLPFTFTWFGGLAWCQHWALRRLLRRQGWLPWRLAAWLDDMVARGLLRRVGGGYIFIHRSLLDYFANLDSAKLGVDKGSLFKHNHH
ncbi:MAG: NACHT domain-containing protein, partial [Anaerolineales bacterium]|nr:NACHT domain-containing protein [Anaerolineales bacterium]